MRTSESEGNTIALCMSAREKDGTILQDERTASGKEKIGENKKNTEKIGRMFFLLGKKNAKKNETKGESTDTTYLSTPLFST